MTLDAAGHPISIGDTVLIPIEVQVTAVGALTTSNVSTSAPVLPRFVTVEASDVFKYNTAFVDLVYV